MYIIKNKLLFKLYKIDLLWQKNYHITDTLLLKQLLFFRIYPRLFIVERKSGDFI